MPQINGDRLLADLAALRAFGAHGNGVVRPSLSEVDVASRHWLKDQFEAAGLDAEIDGVGNVFGRSRQQGSALLVGSHSDTQPTGGWLDGALGVVYGLEVARALSEDPETAELAVDVVAWVDEEGTFMSCLGSRSYIGQLDDLDFATVLNAAGESLSAALEAAELHRVPPIRFQPGRYRGYLEAHIEQGPYLEANREQIGVVSAIVGIRGFTVEFHGQQNHAGTTPMHLRRDAGMALIEFGHAVNTRFKRIAGDRTVWTIGRAVFHPGAPSIIPGRATMQLQMRDPDNECLIALQQAVMEIAEQMTRDGPVDVDCKPNRDPILPTIMDSELLHHIAQAAEQHAPGRWRHMPSAAGHDPMVLSEKMPCAMLFIPSIGGISHDFAEDSHAADIVLGAQVLTDAAANILKSSRT